MLGLAAALASALLTLLVIQYAHQAQMHDAPGARRMHRQPTVRGAGLGFVAVIIAGWGGLGLALGYADPLGRWALCAALGVLVVAVVSWMDDRRPLPVLPRLLAHVVGALIVTWGVWPSWSTHYPQPLLLCVPVVLLVPAINFWNFVDGINGLAASQAAVVATGLAALAVAAGDVPASWFSAIVGGALLGFLPSNFPKARAFMGDVGSASLGLIVGALALQPVRETAVVLPAVFLLAALVFLDTGLTLAWRMLRRPRRRWYTAHREHLYQWLTRAGWGHVRTTTLYFIGAAGTLLTVLFIGPLHPDLMLIAVIVTYLVGAVLWRLGRDYALQQSRRRS